MGNELGDSSSSIGRCSMDLPGLAASARKFRHLKPTSVILVLIIPGAQVTDTCIYCYIHFTHQHPTEGMYFKYYGLGQTKHHRLRACISNIIVWDKQNITSWVLQATRLGLVLMNSVYVLVRHPNKCTSWNTIIFNSMIN